MAASLTTRALVAAIVLTAASAYAQNAAPPPCPANTKSTAQSPCAPAQKPSSAPSDDPFPFPGEISAPASPQTPAATTPDAPAPAKSGSSDQFPFPGEAPATPAKSDSDGKFPFPGEAPADSSSSSSSSSSGGGDASPEPAPDRPVLSTRKHPGKLAPPPPTDDEREMEDLKVARFYRDKGNFNAVYLRSKDAVKVIPDDPAAHLLLAEAAQKLQKRDEAIAEYTAALKLDPTEEQKKAATRALEDLKVADLK